MKRGKIHESAVLGLYSILNIIISFFHEPWYDEAEAWLIARDASFADILLVRPHYEGHPPLWHLILSLPAKLGLPYEPSIKTIQFLLAVTVVYLILFKSPFPRSVRLFLPFTFFFLYQYGVIARPYALVCIALFLIAMHWRKRNEHPWSMVAFMILLCLGSAYGITIAGGMSAVWVVESFVDDRNSFFKDRKRLMAWGVLLVTAFAIVAMITPLENTYATVLKDIVSVHGFVWMFLFFWLIVPADCIVTSTSDYACIFDQDTDVYSFVATAIISILIWLLLIYVCRSRKKILLLLIPYLMLAVIAASAYLNVHHYGIVLDFFISILWICFDEKPLKCLSVNQFAEALVKTPNNFMRKILVMFSYALIVVVATVNLLWSAVSFVYEIRYNYSGSRDFAEFVTENDLNNYRWFGAWRIIWDPDDEDKVFLEDAYEVNLDSVAVNPYLKKGLLANAGEGVTYVEHRVASEQETDEKIAEWKSEPEPDFILASYKDLPIVKDRLGLTSNYIQMRISSWRRIWKSDPFPEYMVYIFVRGDIYDKAGLKTLTD